MNTVCDTLQISRAGYYAWRSKRIAVRAAQDRELIPLVRNILWHH